MTSSRTPPPSVADIPAGKTVEMTADFDRERTPTGQTVGTCWRCWLIKPVVIVSPPPSSSHEALRFTTCIESRDVRWAFCGVRLVLRLGDFEIYLGPDRRVIKLAPLVERRGVSAPPREDGDKR